MSDPLQNRIGLHTWTLDTTPLSGVLAAAREAGYASVELRYFDFKRCADTGLSNAQALDLIRAGRVPISVIGTEGGLLFSRGEERGRLLASLDLACANAASLACDTVMISPGRHAASELGTARDAAAVLRQGGEIAARHGVRLALEFNSRHPVINRVEVAQEMLAWADHPACGLLLDAYHLHCSGAGGRGFEQVPPKDIFAFQFSDAPPGPPSQVRTPVDRMPPGKGAVRWSEVFGLLAEKGYRGAVNYEAPNPAQWSRPPLEVAREGLREAKALMAAAGV